MRAKSTLAVVAVNGLALAALSYAFVTVTDRYIEKRRASTLVYSAHPLHHHHLKANQSLEVYGSHIEIGPHNLRGKVPQNPKPKEELRIFVMGGSSVFDAAAAPSWPQRLGPAIEAKGGPKVTTFNGGVPGFSSRETVALYKDKVRFFKPDIVVLYQGWNDAKYMMSFKEEVDVEDFYLLPTHHNETYRFLNSPRPTRNWLAFTRMLSDFGSDSSMREQVKLGRATDAELRDRDLDVRWAETEGMKYWRSNIRDFVNAVKSDGATPILVPQGTLVTADLSAEQRARVRYKFVQVGHADIVEITDEMNGVLAQVAQTSGTPFLDVRAEINGEPSYFNDHVHLTDAGSRAVADAVAAALVPVLRARTQPQAAQPQTAAQP